MLADETINELKSRLASQIEWLLIRSNGENFALRNTEIELESTNNKLLFNFLNNRGFQTWRVSDCKFKNDEIVLHLTRNFKRENEKIRFVPRISASKLGAKLEAARLDKANKIAAMVAKNFPRVKLIRVELNKENGRFARIIFENANGVQTTILADVTDSLTPEILLSTAILWLSKLDKRKKKLIENVWIIAEEKTAKSLCKTRSLLGESWKRKIIIKEIFSKDAKTSKRENLQNEFVLREKPNLLIEDLWREKAKEIRLPKSSQITRTARKIIECAPDEIDVVFSRIGETLRFLGLPFARVRTILGEEKVWFGTEKKRTLLTEKNSEDFFELIDNLKNYRRYSSPNKRHALFQFAPEAWLEAILRRNIKLLDANLVLSPLYHQFRAGRDKIDLLALRKDGQLVIIEIKVSPDREMIFQAADYWRKIELQRRKGNLQKTLIFGDMNISDKPTIVYLVAPTLSFHKDFKFLASTISSEIEIHRFNLAENWRENVKVLGREKI